MENQEQTSEDVNANQHYLNSMEMWLKGQKRIISGLRITVDNAVKMVEHFEAVKDLDEKQLRHESHYLESTMNNLREWCEHNKIEIPDWAK